MGISIGIDIVDAPAAPLEGFELEPFVVVDVFGLPRWVAGCEGLADGIAIPGIPAIDWAAAGKAIAASNASDSTLTP